MEHEQNKECAVRFERIDATHGDILRRISKMEAAFFGNGKTGFRDEFVEFKNKIIKDLDELQGAIYEQDRFLERLEKSQKEIQKQLEAGSEGDKNRKNEIVKTAMSNAGAILTLIVNAAVIYFLFRLTGQMP